MDPSWFFMLYQEDPVIESCLTNTGYIKKNFRRFRFYRISRCKMPVTYSVNSDRTHSALNIYILNPVWISVRIHLNFFKWIYFQMNSNGFKWIQTDSNEFKWIQMEIQMGFKWFPTKLKSPHKMFAEFCVHIYKKPTPVRIWAPRASELSLVNPLYYATDPTTSEAARSKPRTLHNPVLSSVLLSMSWVRYGHEEFLLKCIAHSFQYIGCIVMQLFGRTSKRVTARTEMIVVFFGFSVKWPWFGFVFSVGGLSLRIALKWSSGLKDGWATREGLWLRWNISSSSS